jgi:hypothetical protein
LDSHALNYSQAFVCGDSAYKRETLLEIACCFGKKLFVLDFTRYVFYALI